MASKKVGVKPGQISGKVTRVDRQNAVRTPLTKLEKQARREAKSQSIRVAAYYGDVGNSGSMAISEANQNFYSPQLSTDFLELPQSEREKRELLRFWYNAHPIIGAAIDFHTDVPMSKIRLSSPKGKDITRNKQILHFYEKMCGRLRLFQTLYDVTHEYWLQGSVFIFCEDHDLSGEIPDSLMSDTEIIFDSSENPDQKDHEDEEETRSDLLKKMKEERSKSIQKFVEKEYDGWQRLQILPPEQVKLEIFQYTNRVQMELIPSEKDRLAAMKAQEQNDIDSQKIADGIPDQIRENLLSGQPIPLNTTPYDDFLCSSFCFHLSHKRSPYEDRGTSILERCHLPGTEVTARRDGQVLQISIEELDPETDEVLGGSGKWRKFRKGSRPYNGSVISLDVAKLAKPVECTPDHRMYVVRGDPVQERQVRADEVVAGDYVRVATVQEEKIDRINLRDFFSDSSWPCVCRRDGGTRLMKVSVEETSDDHINLTHRWFDDNPQREARSELLQRVVGWINGLSEPVLLTAGKFKSMHGGMSESVFRALIRDLGKLGYDAPLMVDDQTKFKNKARLFKSAQLDCGALREKFNVQKCPGHLTLTLGLGYIVGYFLGDGWIESTRDTPTSCGPSGVCYSPDIENSVESASLVETFAKDIGVEVGSREYNLRWITINIDWFNRWLSANFGRNKSDKHLPEWVMGAPESFKLGLLGGLIDSDGWVSKYSKQSGYVDATICMTTKVLIDQLQTMAYCMSLSPSRRFKPGREVKQANGQTSSAMDQHSLVFGCSDDLRRIRGGECVKLREVDIPERKSSGRRHKTIDGKVYLKVTGSIEKRPGNVLVHSLDVDEDHTFFAGFTLTRNCLRTLLYQDKLRQAQTSIASRAMTPKRIIWGDKMSQLDVDNLRDQIDQALIDPDFSIITNFEVHWDEVGARDRLLDLGTEYEITNKLLFIGLRITESMLTGESTYSGERIHLDVMNTMYLLYRETLADFVEQYLFAPVAEKKGFWEEDEYGNRNLLFPKLQFTRLALRDNTEMQDFMFNLYQKGSMPIDYIYDLLNIDSEDAHLLLERDMFTPKDSTFNEITRALYSRIGENMADKTDAMERVAKNMGLNISDEEGDRFGKE